MRRALLTFSAAFAFGMGATTVDAQLAFGIHGAVITSVDQITTGPTSAVTNNTQGVGARLLVSPPLFPAAIVAAADYYFVACPMDITCSLWTGQIGVNLGIPLPIVEPYIHGGYNYRKDAGDATNAWVAGAGIQLNFAVSLFVEGMMEFTEVPTGLSADLDVRPIVIKAGLIF